MLTIDTLRAYGANVDEGVKRCINSEAFYLKMVQKVKENLDSCEKLKEEVEAKDLDKAFETAHALKGVLANLSLTPLLQPVSEITELLRARTDTDYSELTERITQKKDELLKLMD